MDKETLIKIKTFYEEVILQQIIKPQEINEIYLLVKPDGQVMQPYYKKMRAITVFIQGYQQEVLDNLDELFEEVKEIADVNNPTHMNYIAPVEITTSIKEEVPTPLSQYVGETLSINPSGYTQSHSEVHDEVLEDCYPPEENTQVIDNDPNENSLDGDNEDVKDLTPTEQIENLKEQYKEADANLKRSITQRINKIKKDMEK